MHRAFLLTERFMSFVLMRQKRQRHGPSTPSTPCCWTRHAQALVAGRHPDAKWLRRIDDVYALARTQKRLLKALWPLLKPGGRLLYGTCSVFALENQTQIANFLSQHPDARLESQTSLLPDAWHDGFFYALLTKVPA